MTEWRGIGCWRDALTGVVVKTRENRRRGLSCE